MASIALALDGYLPVNEQVNAGGAEPAIFSKVLEPDPNSPNAPIGSVRVVYTPATAEMMVDGLKEGSGSPVLVEHLKLNAEHTLKLVSAGYETIFFPFKLDSRDTLEIQLDMSTAVTLGKVDITSVPPGAEVWIGGDKVGVTPLVGLELPANQNYTVELRRDGYDRWRSGVYVRATGNRPVEATLRGGPPPAPAPGRSAPSRRKPASGGKPAADDGKYPLLLGK